MKKAQFLELDIFFALLILISGILLVRGQYIHSYDSPQTSVVAQDAVQTLQIRTMQTLSSDYITGLQVRLDAVPVQFTLQANETIARQLTMLIILAEKESNTPEQRAAIYNLVSNLTTTALIGVIQPQYYYNVTLLSNEERYTILGTSEPGITVSQARILLSGLEINKTIYGYSATAYLSSLASEQAVYTDFGGFVGQGNITTYLTLPATPLSFSLEGDFHDSFIITINNAHCADIAVNAATDINVISENLDSCLPLFTIGTNSIHINFTGPDITKQYIGGGYLKASYLSEEVYTQPSSITTKQSLPGIQGIFNLFDAVYVPGELQDMNIYLHYFANHSGNNNTAFFTLGETIIHTDNESTTEQTIHFSSTELQNMGIDFSEYTNKSIPFRFGYDNGTIQQIASNIIDVVLVTDVSGSMNWRYDNNNAGTVRSCNNGQLYSLSTQRLSVAKCASKNFTSLILHDAGQLIEPNRIGLTSYSTNLVSSQALTADEATLTSRIDSYTPLSSTCICCGILGAVQVFQNDPEHELDDPGITRAMLIMTDGVANQIGNCRTTLDPLYATPNPLGGYYSLGDANAYAIAAARYAYEYHNISIYTVGFGTAATINVNTLQQMAAVQNISHYYLADSPEKLTTIYNDIARDIIRTADYQAQTISFEIAINNSILYPDSSIEYTYKPNSLPSLRGQLLLDGERRPFGNPTACEAINVNFPLALYPLSGRITSYSGNHWTEKLIVNGAELYNLQDYGTMYRALGDPFSIGIPIGRLNRGPNAFTLHTADNPEEQTGCSPYNKLIYTAALNNTISLQEIYPEAIGCTWTVSMLGEELILPLPEDYTGSTTCSYTPTNIAFNNQDAWQALAYHIFNSFDVYSDGDLDIHFTQSSLDIHMNTQERIPYLWGPALLEVTVWQ